MGEKINIGLLIAWVGVLLFGIYAGAWITIVIAAFFLPTAILRVWLDNL